MIRNILTTIDIANILGVHQTTVARWIDKGKLKSMMTLGGHRRVKKDDLILFFKENGMPVPEEFGGVRKTKILIVDDDKMVLNVLSEGLRRYSEKLIIYTAEDGFIAGDLVGTERPDIVVLDIKLPGIDGFKTCEMIKERYPHTLVIAITGHGSPEIKARIRESGADDYMEKPFETEELLLRIQQLSKNRLALK